MPGMVLGNQRGNSTCKAYPTLQLSSSDIVTDRVNIIHLILEVMKQS